MTLEYEVEMDEEHVEACIGALEFYLDQHALFIGDATVEDYTDALIKCVAAYNYMHEELPFPRTSLYIPKEK